MKAQGRFGPIQTIFIPLMRTFWVFGGLHRKFLNSSMIPKDNWLDATYAKKVIQDFI